MDPTGDPDNNNLCTFPSIADWEYSLTKGDQSLSAYFLYQYLVDKFDLDAEAKAREETRKKAAAVLRRLDPPEDETQDDRPPRKEDLVLTQYEQAIAMDVIAPEDIPVSFKDIGGLQDIIEELRESVIYPLTMPGTFFGRSSLMAAPSGVLLYGPPGCGKTMLAKALAHESGATFINLHISTLTEKWYGDSNKLVSAVFTLARKLQPTIVFIDEIDAVLGTRRSGDHEASGMVKAEFMTHWDGLASANSLGQPQRIMVLGATNRVEEIDEAILRRMPKKFPVPLPASQQRKRILSLLLQDTKIDQDNFDLDYLVKITSGLSGSDLKEACRDAAMVPVREMIRSRQAQGLDMARARARDIRGIRTSDFFSQAGGVNVLQNGRTYATEVTRPASSAGSISDTEEEMQDASES